MLRDLYDEIREILTNSGIDTADIDARYILEERLDVRFSDIISRPDLQISSEHIAQVHDDVARRCDGMPLSRLYGEREFWGLSFSLSKDTLDPRPDTETIIDLALKRFDKDSNLRILDLGTGSGCILISLLSEFPNALGVGVDISQGAVDIAAQNAKCNDVFDRCDFMRGSWFDSVDGEFDLIVSNPPYIRSDVIPELSVEVREYDPIPALDGGTDGLEPYKIIFSQIKSYFKKGGIGLFEIGYDQSDDVMRLAEESGFAQRCVHPDIARNPRVVEISCGDK